MAKAASETKQPAKHGRQEVHQPMDSLEPWQWPEEHWRGLVDQVRAAKPSGIKGNYIHSITVSATMSPGIRVTA